DKLVTGVQTCALPISRPDATARLPTRACRTLDRAAAGPGTGTGAGRQTLGAGTPGSLSGCLEGRVHSTKAKLPTPNPQAPRFVRSEERRVGKEDRTEA